MSNITASRYGFIDSIRGIAACLVMLQHSLYTGKILAEGSDSFLYGLLPNLLELGQTGVVAFFLVSGFVIPLSLEKTANFRLFWVHRILRIYPLYLAVYVVSLFVQGGGSLEGTVAFIKNIGAHLLMVQEYVKQPNFVGGSWTLAIEMVWYIGLSGLFLLGLNKKTNLLVALALLASAAACVVCAFGLHMPMGRLSMLVCCVFGLVCYRRERGEITRKHFFVLCAALVLMIASNLVCGFLLFPASDPTSSLTTVQNSWSLAALVFFVPFAFRGLPVWDHSILAFLGRISYSIYLVHGLVLHGLKDTPVTGWALVALTFVVTLPLAALTYRLIESPPIRWGKRFKHASQEKITNVYV
jgi:peptidoglycan/LPS O-acetylase OafA/YrhL